MQPLCYLLIGLLSFSLIDDTILLSPDLATVSNCDSDDEYLSIERDTLQNWPLAHLRPVLAVQPFVGSRGTSLTSPSVTEFLNHGCFGWNSHFLVISLQI
jgi:hypothetical protein